MIVPTFLLTAGLIDDLLTKKVHNSLSAALFLIAFIFSLYQGQLLAGGLGLGTAAALFFPLFALGVLGAGDAKLMMAFGLATSAEAVALVSLYGLVWAGIFGLTKIAISHNWSALGHLLAHITSGFHLKLNSATYLPMTFPLMLGWLTYIHLQGVGS